MNYKILIFLLLAFFSCSGQDKKMPADSAKWEGMIKADKVQLNLIFKFNNGKCFLDVPAQGIPDYPASKFRISGDSIIVAFSGLIQAEFGGINQKDTLITGSWIQLGKIYPMVLRKKKAYQRPQNPQFPLPYKVENVTFPNRDKSIKFGGTLTIPEKGNKHPAAILISGSGQEDRDETLFGHKPFLVIADYLTRNGIAVLRTDDRGIGETTGGETISKATSLDFALDVLAGMDYLKSRSDIDPLKIGLIGHSEGGLIASIVGARRNDLAFIVSLAGVGVTGKAFVLSQYENNLRRSLSTPTVDTIIAFEAIAIDIIKSEPNNRLAEVEIINSFLGKNLSIQDSVVKTYFGMTIKDGFETYNIKGAIMHYKSLMLPWYRYLLAYDPGEVLPRINVPFLALNGEKDLQVSADLNLNGFKSTFNKHGKTNFKIISYPDLNHFFQHCETGNMEEVESIEETISAEVLLDILTWIKEQL